MCTVSYLKYTIHDVKYETTHNMTPNEEYTKQSLILRISSLYALKALKDKMHPQDQHCFRKLLKDWDLSTSTDMKKWLHKHRLHIKQCLTLEKSRLKTHTHDIRNWMKPKQNNKSHQDENKTQHKTKNKSS